MGIIRIRLIADTHLGFDLSFRPRIQRRRRGPEFFANFERALGPALNRQVDAVVHGGDVLYRSKVPARLMEAVIPFATATMSSAAVISPAILQPCWPGTFTVSRS